MIDLSRRGRTPIAQWWWNVDKAIIFHVAVLMVLGGVLCLAATPTLALRLNLPPYHFVVRHVIFYVPSLVLMLWLSLLSPRQIRQLCVCLFFAAFLGMIACLFLGPVVKGARRWLDVFGFTVQPSEFVKPFFVVLIANILSAMSSPYRYLASLGIYAALALVLFFQPDFGQMMLVTGVLFAMFFIGEVPVVFLGGLCAIAAALVGASYFFLPHVARRINAFFLPGGYDTYQTDKAIQAFSLGGLFGRGPGEGVIKKILPDAHTDFVFSVAVEEYGGIFAVLIIFLFCTLVLRSLSHALREESSFLRIAISGLSCLLAMQTFTNIAVNIRVMPTKGMTLPFISYGGSSMLALSVGVGILLALTRKDAALFLR